jgi:hypothetical protein
MHIVSQRNEVYLEISQMWNKSADRYINVLSCETERPVVRVALL